MGLIQSTKAPKHLEVRIELREVRLVRLVCLSWLQGGSPTSGKRSVRPTTLEATQGQILSQSPTDATSSR